MGDNYTMTDEVTLIITRWIYKVKVEALGEVLRFKARVVAKVKKQLEHVDFFDTFALVLK